MQNDIFDRLDRYVRDGFLPPERSRDYRCGICGNNVSSDIGLGCHEWTTAALGPGWDDTETPTQNATDIRICTTCRCATTFVKGYQIPSPLPGRLFDHRSSKHAKSTDVKMIVDLYQEARRAMADNSCSCAVLMFRKLLMHIGVEQGADENKRFAYYTDYLKNNGIVGKPQHGILDRVKDAGNQENHEIKRASEAEAGDLLRLVAILIESVYFTA